MLARKLPIFSDLGPMKYELMTLWGLFSLRGSFILVFSLCPSSFLEMSVRPSTRRGITRYLYHSSFS